MARMWQYSKWVLDSYMHSVHWYLLLWSRFFPLAKHSTTTTTELTKSTNAGPSWKWFWIRWGSPARRTTLLTIDSAHNKIAFNIIWIRIYIYQHVDSSAQEYWHVPFSTWAVTVAHSVVGFRRRLSVRQTCACGDLMCLREWFGTGFTIVVLTVVFHSSCYLPSIIRDRHIFFCSLGYHSLVKF